jgi:hypothetical protein
MFPPAGFYNFITDLLSASPLRPSFANPPRSRPSNPHSPAFPPSLTHKHTRRDDSQLTNRHHCSLLIAHYSFARRPFPRTTPQLPRLHSLASPLPGTTRQLPPLHSLTSHIAGTTRNSQIDTITHCSLFIRPSAHSPGRLASSPAFTHLQASSPDDSSAFLSFTHSPAYSQGRLASPLAVAPLKPHPSSLTVHTLSFDT